MALTFCVTNHEAQEFLDSDYDANYLYEVEKISLEVKKVNINWLKREFEDKKKNSYGIENRNDMTSTQNNEVNNIYERNLLRDIINPP